MSVLVTGGAGYIGSHMVRALLAQGEEVVVLDNFSKGFPQAVAHGAKLVGGDLLDGPLVEKILREHQVDAVIHFAAFSLVGESMADPLKYYTNNVAGTLSLLTAMQKVGVDKIVFSSTASTFGAATQMPITEQTEQKPVSVYGNTKLMMEQILKDCSMAYGIRSIALRYFNVAGAHESGEIGEAHDPETHIIPNIIAILQGKWPAFMLFGTDFPTKDGTCVRDYIHIQDLVDAHLLSLNALRNGAASTAYNLGNGKGFSNREIIQAVEEVTGQKVKVVETDRRAGDPPTSYTSSDKIKKELGWEPKHTTILDIVASAWKWHQSHPNGY